MKKDAGNPKGAWWAGLIAAFAAAFLFTFTPYWQLVLAAGVIGGLFCSGLPGAAFFAGLGAALAWTVYIYLQDAAVLLDQVGDLVIGGKGNGLIIAAAVVLIGGIIGAVGGALGRGLRRLAAGV